MYYYAEVTSSQTAGPGVLPVVHTFNLLVVVLYMVIASVAVNASLWVVVNVEIGRAHV